MQRPKPADTKARSKLGLKLCINTLNRLDPRSTQSTDKALGLSASL